MEIHRATTANADALLDLQRVAFISEAELNNDFNIPPLTQTLAELITEFEHKTILKVILNGELVASGQVYFKNASVHIGRMAVLPKLQGQGIGSQLFTALEKTFPNAQRFELFTGEHSQKNLAMYQRRGYKPFKVEKFGSTKVLFLKRYT
ncbi:GNAT family N-acetyltransferase [Acinetobacter sp. A3.8]|uniref:GNAT family N-acetyltransferase n=1 Tax=Acinetobacter sedimenti TaxID=2919922 RepID=A0A9X1WVU6_9GAMM|nr:GNAT family N-acetyltransferase [Acinetobacter sedimenti]MCJ8145453.1 GNAT family N-acetyltransferase [Acinetobacter sedimenti]